MTISIEQANALLKEYAELIKIQQGEIIAMRKQLDQLKFDLSSVLDKEYDV